MTLQKTLRSPIEIRSLEESGFFEGYASVFDDPDHALDKVAPGAFAKSLDEYRLSGRLPPLLWQHNVKEPIGAWREIFEDEKGLFVRGELFIHDIPLARQALKLVRENVVTGLSIGFRTVKSELDAKTGERTLLEIDLLEISLVTFPALDSARVASVKERLKTGVVPDKRDFEAFLREAGFSRKQAKGLLAAGYKGLTRRDAGPAPSTGDDVLSSVRKLSGLIRSLS